MFGKKEEDLQKEERKVFNRTDSAKLASKRLVTRSAIHNIANRATMCYTL